MRRANICFPSCVHLVLLVLLVLVAPLPALAFGHTGTSRLQRQAKRPLLGRHIDKDAQAGHEIRDPVPTTFPAQLPARLWVLGQTTWLSLLTLNLVII